MLWNSLKEQKKICIIELFFVYLYKFKIKQYAKNNKQRTME